MVYRQILITERSCDVYAELEDVVPVLRKLSTSTMGVQQIQTALQILDRLVQ